MNRRNMEKCPMLIMALGGTGCLEFLKKEEAAEAPCVFYIDTPDEPAAHAAEWRPSTDSAPVLPRSRTDDGHTAEDERSSYAGLKYSAGCSVQRKRCAAGAAYPARMNRRCAELPKPAAAYPARCNMHKASPTARSACPARYNAAAE